MLKRTLLRRIAGVAAIAVTGVVLAAPSPAHADFNFTVRIQNSDTALYARAGNTVTNSQISQNTFLSSHNQWEEVPVNGNRALQFRNTYSQKCLDVGGNQLSGAPVVQALCDINNPKQWWFYLANQNTAAVDDYFYLNGFTGFYLSVQNSSVGSGLVQLPSTGLLSQSWVMRQVQ